MFAPYSLRASICSCLLLFVALPTTRYVGQEAFAQDFEVISIGEEYHQPTIPPKATRAERREIRAKISAARSLLKSDARMAHGGLEGSSDFNEERVGNYFRRYLFAQMTQTDDQSLAQLGELRQMFVRDFLSAKVIGDQRQFVIEYSLTEFSQIAKGNFHPAVRLNAVLLIGQINQTEPTRTQSPKPSTEAIQFLIAMMQDESLPVYLKVGAMTGLHRNTLFDSKHSPPQIPGGLREQLASLSASIIAGKFGGQSEWKNEPNYCLRRRATQMLGHLRASQFSEQLIATFSDPNEKQWVRFDAMMSIGEMNLDPKTTDSAIEEVTEYTASVLRKEAFLIQDEIAELLSINLLYGDVNLLEKGVARKDRLEGKKGEMLDGLGSNEGFNESAEARKPKIDLPVYRLNASRRHIQAVSSSARQVLNKLNSLPNFEKSELAAEVSSELEMLIAEANVGLTDLSKGQTVTGDKTKAIADQLSELFAATAEKLECKCRESGSVSWAE